MEREEKKLSASFKVGAIALAFLIIGYQAATVMHRAAVLRITANRDHPDTVFVVERSVLVDDVPVTPSGGVVVGRSGSHSPTARRVYESSPSRRVESFRFNPNTATLEDFQRLGFSERQAQSILNYRDKGGRFRRKSDFAKSFVVVDSVYERLEPFIDIPLIDINAADSTEFDTLPGIGPYYAAQMVRHREELGGYSYPEQLMDIYKFDREKFDGLADLIVVGPSDSLALWTAGEEELRRHPYIDRRAAHGIVLFRENNPPENLTVEALVAAGILDEENGRKLARCRISARR